MVKREDGDVDKTTIKALEDLALSKNEDNREDNGVYYGQDDQFCHLPQETHLWLTTRVKCVQQRHFKHLTKSILILNPINITKWVQ